MYLLTREHKVVQTRREVCVVVDGLVDRIVLEPKVQNSLSGADIRRGKRDERRRCKCSAECRTCNSGHKIGGAAAEARASKCKIRTG